MRSFAELLSAIVQLLIYVIIFTLQVLAPLMTLVFLVVTFINPTNMTMTIFYISAISYFLGYLTSSLGMKSIVPIYEKSYIDRHHPLISAMIDMVIIFAPSFFIAFIICSIFEDFTYYLHNSIMVNWFYRIIKYFMNKKRLGTFEHNISDNDVSQTHETSETLDVEKLSAAELLQLAKEKNSIYYLNRNVPKELKMLQDLEKQVSFQNRLMQLTKVNHIRQNETDDFDNKIDASNNDKFILEKSVSEQNKESKLDYKMSIEKYLETLDKDLFFTATSLTYGFKKIKSDLQVNNGNAIFGSLFISQKTWLDSKIYGLNDIVDMLLDARSSTCTLDEYWDVHGYGTPFSYEVDFLTNLSMTVSCKSINVNKPDIEDMQIINFVIACKDRIRKVVQDTMDDNYDLGMMKSIVEINIVDGIKQYEKLIKGFNEIEIQPK